METTYDVVLVGYGPVGQALALMLGRQGRKVAVCERWPARYPLPRAVCLDHEIYRVLAANGMRDVLPTISEPAPKYQWFNAEWEELLVLDFDQESISGGTETNFIHQPTLERAMSEAVASGTEAELFLGWQVTEIDQDANLCRLSMTNEMGEVRPLSARYLVGCDGANSLVRQAIGGGQEDRGFEADWLVIDVLLKDGVTIEKLRIPPAGQYCNPLRPTTIVPAGVREGKTFRRWEFMRLPGEAVEDMEREERIWELLAPWAGPQDVELVRHKIYNFRSLLAAKWRDRRFLIAGDAAHVMPPFMGQGMCSGIRDAWNLCWKLALVLDGKAEDTLLDTFQAERMPHASQVIDLSIYLGKVICMPDPEEAAARDRAFREGLAPPPPAFPHLTTGLLRRNRDGMVQPGAGLLAPHVTVERDGVRQRFDDVAEIGFVLITQDDGSQDDVPAWTPDAELHASLEAIGFQKLQLSKSRQAGGLVDLDGRFASFFEKNGWDAMIVRPDFYVFGGSLGLDDRGSLVEDLLRQLTAAGLHQTAAAVLAR